MAGERKPLQRTVRILLECILALFMHELLLSLGVNEPLFSTFKIDIAMNLDGTFMYLILSNHIKPSFCMLFTRDFNKRINTIGLFN